VRGDRLARVDPDVGHAEPLHLEDRAVHGVRLGGDREVGEVLDHASSGAGGAVTGRCPPVPGSPVAQRLVLGLDPTELHRVEVPAVRDAHLVDVGVPGGLLGRRSGDEAVDAQVDQPGRAGAADRVGHARRRANEVPGAERVNLGRVRSDAHLALALKDEEHLLAVEGRKFGLALAIASQSLGGLGERLRETVLTNAACLALLSPGADDARGLARLVAPIPIEELSSMRRFEVLLRMPGPDGRPGVYGGTVNPPGPADEARAAAIIARSDARDARPLDDVAAEVARRSGPIPERETQAQGEVEGAAKGAHT